ELPRTSGKAQGDGQGVGQPLQVQVGGVDVSGLTVYQRPHEKPAIVQPTGFQTGQFLPRGYTLAVYLIRPVNTLDLSGMVELGIGENAVFNHHLQLPFGTRIYGTASTPNVSDRIAISVDAMVFPDGQELPITGVVLDMDGLPGVRGYYFPQPIAVQAFPYLNEAAIGFLESNKSLDQTVTASTQGLSTRSRSTLKNQVNSGAQKGIASALQHQQEELDRRYPPYVLVKAGTGAWIQLTTALDLNARAINALASRAQPRSQPEKG
ncbi:MAG TPA: TrbI/VirB10 family protein, partial [Opitutaceae bacterium]|nr:TrbI/VirB10 family protein [Opitutaceae bacterium]